MSYTKVITILLLFIFSSNLFAQAKDYRKIEKKLITGLEKNIILFRKESDILREKMIQIVNKEGLKEKYVLGIDRELINEGMSKLFSKRPQAISIRMNRKKNLALLEQYHIDLYNADIKLLFAKELLHLIQIERKKGEKNQLLIDFSDGYKKRQSKRKKSQRLADIVIMHSAAYENGYLSKVFEDETVYDLGREELPLAYTCKKKDEDIDYENKEIVIGASYPMNGQYNFHPEEGGSKQWGYIAFEKLDKSLLLGKDIFIKWTNTEGESIFYPVKKQLWETFLLFRLPTSFFKSKKIYKAQIAVKERDENYNYQPEITAQQRSIFGLKSKDKTKKFEGMTLLGKPIYFRVSKYRSSYDKLAAIPPYSIDSKGRIHITLPEPLDNTELKGKKCYKSSYRFNYQNNLAKAIKKIQTSRIAYFMTTPSIEPIDTNDIGKPYIAFLDHSFEDLSIVYAEGAAKFGDTGLDFKTPSYAISQNFAVPKISESNFITGTSNSLDAKLQIYYPDLAIAQQQYNNVIQKILERSKKRSEYFYKLYIVDAKRKKITPKYGLSFFEDREKDVLDLIIPEAVRKVLLTEILTKDVSVRASVNMPGTTLNVTIQDLKKQ